MPLAAISSIVPRVFARRQAVASEPTSQLVKPSPTEALRYYATPGIPPPSARIDPKLKVAVRRPPRFWEYWKFAALAATKATHVTSEVLSHKIWGPRRKTWGIEMTIVTSLIREIEAHADLVDIDLVRMAMSLTGLVPLPSDALVTPVTFHVKRRNLRGILAEYDAAETGRRELNGEWVVGRKTWQRLQHEWKSGKPRAEGDTTATRPRQKESVILYIHGGAYYLSCAAAQRIISIPLSKWADARVFAIDYRLAPETCFPGPLHDAVSAYLRLVEDLSIPPQNIIIAGDSAGGGLCLALLLYLRDNSYPLPSGAILMSPWCDLTLSCESWDLNSAFDVVPFPSANNHMNPIALYLGEHMEKYLTHPYASPLFGDMKGLPPLLIQAGEAEVLRDEITLLAHKATLAGVEVFHELYEDCIHVFQAYPFLDASKQAFGSIRKFVKHMLPQIQSRFPQILPTATMQGLEKELEASNRVLVRGDGVEMDTNDKELQDFANSSSGNVSEHASDSEDDKDVPPSWARSPTWSPNHHTGVFSLATSLPGEETLSPPNLNKIPIMKLTPSTPQLTPFTSRTTPIASSSRPRAQSLRHPPSPPKLGARPRASHLALRTSALAMSSVANPTPPPAIRRSAKGGSHPDLTSLVDNWSKVGPANQTFLYTSTSR